MNSEKQLCVLLAQYREATGDLNEALEFFRTVHADELLGYDGDSVRHIVDTLRASRPHLYPSMSAVFSYNATPPHNRSLSVIVADVRQRANESDWPPTATDSSAATVEPRSRVGSAVNRIDRRPDMTVPDGRELWAAAGRRSPDRWRRQAVEADGTRERKQLASSASKRSSEARDNEIIGSEYVVEGSVDKTIVVVRNSEHHEMTSGPDYHDDDEHDDDKDRKLADADVEDAEVEVTAYRVVQGRNDSTVVVPANDSSDFVNATLNATSFPPPRDRKYVDTLFKIAHIFHLVGIGILAFFVLQVVVSARKERKQLDRQRKPPPRHLTSTKSDRRFESGLIPIWIRMPAGSLPKYCGFVILSVSFISPSVVKIGR